MDKRISLQSFTLNYRNCSNADEIDAVIIATPTTGMRMAIEAANAGKHIYLENP
jgi:predicted dehydrogenase